MKFQTLLLAALVCGLAPARAEDAPALLQTPDLIQAPVPPTATPDAVPAPSAPAPMKKGTAEQLRQAIRIRELKTVVEEDPELVAQKAAAASAKTEEGQRVLMRNYYTLLYTKIEKLDPALRPVLEGQLHEMLRRYEQHNVRPSVLVEPIAALPGSNSADHAASAESADEKASEKKKSKKN